VVVVGGNNVKSRKKLVDFYKKIYPKNQDYVETNTTTAEMIKYTNNAFLATKITFINSMANICQKIPDTNVDDIAKVMGMDPRISHLFLNAGPGFGGSCFRKDILNLVYLCEHYQLNEVASFWEQVVSINDYQMDRFVKRILQAMFNTLVGKKLAVFGFAFKPDTGDTRDAPAVYICKQLLEEKACLNITDPHALDNARKDLRGIDERVDFIDDPYQAVEGVHGIVLITEWKQYKTLNY
jgi:UDPglucose 6-dehydrogenase